MQFNPYAYTALYLAFLVSMWWHNSETNDHASMERELKYAREDLQAIREMVREQKSQNIKIEGYFEREIARDEWLRKDVVELQRMTRH